MDEVLELVGLSAVSDKRSKGFSLGMGQRLGIAPALLGNPRVLMLDEPVNGLDPEGILWIRNLLKHLAGEGRTVFVSSHLMSEMAVTADHLIVVGRGRLIADASTSEVVARSASTHLLVRTPDVDRLAALIEQQGGTTSPDPVGLQVTGIPMERVGELAAANGVVLHELSRQEASLETAFMELTGESVDFRAGATGGMT